MTNSIARITLRPRIPNWTDAIRWENWTRHEAYLRRAGKLLPRQIDSIADLSLSILAKTKPVARDQFQCRGLVVGYVQSGKTANFTALIARAADAGYKLIIVLSGIHDSLRNQTQRRLNKELIETGVDWVTLTSETADFQVPAIADGFPNQGTVLVVAKKIPPILRRLQEWIGDLENSMHDRPVLIIDDEADQASINTKGNRQDPSIDDDTMLESSDPSVTNGLIRDILRRIPRATYIAYTATPFANILIDPNAVDTQVGLDLFPKDFVIQLPRPERYIGTEELFGASSTNRDIIRVVAPEDVKILKSRRARKFDSFVVTPDQGIPHSLCNAILTFSLIGAIRKLRGQDGSPNTMLIHASQLQSDQRRIGQAIQEQLQAWINQERVLPGSIERLLSSAFAHLGKVKLPAEEGVIFSEAKSLIYAFQIVILNSSSGEELEYDVKPNRQLIVIGGNRLSRGLTLEGLTVSYFLRTTSMADSLLQMARWYGFRTGYDDLIRIWTTEGIADWFVELSLVEETLRDSIIAMNRAGRRPDEMAIKMLAHSELLLTSKNKSKMLAVSGRSWSRENPQTTLFPFDDTALLARNFSRAEKLLTDNPSTYSAFGGRMVFDVSADSIIDFIRKFEVHSETISFRTELIADWIAERATADELTSWTIFLPNPDRARTVTLGGHQIGLTQRSLCGPNSIGVLIDPRHEAVDLNGGPSAFTVGETYNATAMRSSRPAKNGLLIIYPLDPSILKVQVPAVIGLALSLPKTSDENVSFVVNRGIVNDNY